MAISLEAFKLSGSVTVEVDGARAKLKAAERDVSNLNLRMKELRAEIAKGGEPTAIRALRDEAKRTSANLAGLRFESAKLKETVKSGAGSNLLDAFGLASFNPYALAVTAVIGGLVAGVGALNEAVQRAASFDSLERGLTAITGSADLAQAKIRELQEIAKQPGLGFREAIQGQVRLEAAGLSASEATRAIAGFGNALATVGKGKAELDGVLTALTQISSKAVLSAEEINQIAERVPQIRQILRSAFGTADTEAIAKQGYTGIQAVRKILPELEKLPKATASAAASFENLSDAYDRALVATGKSLLEPTARILNTVADSLDRNEAAWLRFGEGLATIVEAVAGTVIAVESLDKATGGLIGTAALAANPILSLASTFGEAKDGAQDFFDYLTAKTDMAAGLQPGKSIADNRFFTDSEKGRDAWQRTMAANGQRYAKEQQKTAEDAAAAAKKAETDGFKTRQDAAELFHNTGLKLAENAYRREKAARDGQIRLSANEQIKFLQSEIARETAHYNRKIELLEAYYSQAARLQSQFGGSTGVSSDFVPLIGSVGNIAGGAMRGSTGRADFDGWIREFSAKYGVDPNLPLATMSQESGFRKNATSNKGAGGLLQLMPETFRQMNVGNDRYDPKQNIEAGIKYLAEQLKTFNGNVTLALAAYNAGPGAVQKYKGVPPYAETQDYVRKIVPRYAAMSGDKDALESAKQNAERALAVDDARTAIASFTASANSQIEQIRQQVAERLRSAQIAGIEQMADSASRAWGIAVDDATREFDEARISGIEFANRITAPTDKYFADVGKLLEQKYDKKLNDERLVGRIAGGDADAIAERANIERDRTREREAIAKQRADFDRSNNRKIEQDAFARKEREYSFGEQSDQNASRRRLSETALSLFESRDPEAETKLVRARYAEEFAAMDEKRRRLEDLAALSSFDLTRQQQLTAEIGLLDDERAAKEADSIKEITQLNRARYEESRAALRDILRESADAEFDRQSAAVEARIDYLNDLLETAVGRKSYVDSNGDVVIREQALSRRQLLAEIEQEEINAAARSNDRAQADLAAEKRIRLESIRGFQNEQQLKSEIEELYRNKSLQSAEDFEREKKRIENKYRRQSQKDKRNFAGLETMFGLGADAMKDSGDIMKNTMSELDGMFTAFAGGMASGVGSMVENWVLYGDAGPDALRKMTAQVLASLAAEASVEALMELARGFAALAVGDPNAGAHFAAAAIFGGVAGVAAIAGRAIAGDSFKNEKSGGASSGNGGGGSSGNSTAKTERTEYSRGGFVPSSDGSTFERDRIRFERENGTSFTATGNQNRKGGIGAMQANLLEKVAAVLDRQAAALETFETAKAGDIVQRGVKEKKGFISQTVTTEFAKNQTRATKFGKQIKGRG